MCTKTSKRIKIHLTIVEANVLRKVSRMAAKYNRYKERFDQVKRWNDTAYLGDTIVRDLRKIEY